MLSRCQWRNLEKASTGRWRRHLPNMELHTDALHVTVDEDSISVTVSGLHSNRRHFEDDGVDDGEYGYEEDDEEERIYDEL